MSCPGLDPNCDGLERLNTLSNILAGCVQSDPSTTKCAKLLCDATPGDTYPSTCSGTPADTLGAAYLIVANPSSNVTALYGLASVVTEFSPALTAQPDGWEMALNFNNSNTGSPGALFDVPDAIALDASGNVFVTNEEGAGGLGSVSEV